MSAKIPRDAIVARMAAVSAERLHDRTLDPYPDLPDHAYWSKVLPIAYNRDEELHSLLRCIRFWGAAIAVTQNGHLKLDIGPVFALEPPEFVEWTEDEFKRQFLEPKKQVLVEILREAEREI